MLTRIEGTVVPNSVLGPFSFERILDYYDGPRLILQKSFTGQLILAWWNDEDDDTQRWLHLPVSERRLLEILTGQITCLDALMYPEDGFIYVLDDNVSDESRTRTTLVPPSALPEDSLPHPDARFNYDLPEDVSWIEVRERAHVVDLSLDVGNGDFATRVTAKTAGRAIVSFQKLIDAIGQALEQPSPNLKGKIPDSILEQTRFDPVSTYSGSFGIRLESHVDDHYGNALVRRSLENLFAILRNDHHGAKDHSPAIAFVALAESDHDATAGYRLYHSSRRVTAGMREFLSVVEGALEAVTLTWVTPDPGEPHRIRVSREQAKQMRLLNESLIGNRYASTENTLAASRPRSD